MSRGSEQTGDRLVIRRAGPGDADELVRLRLALLHELGEVGPEVDTNALATAIRSYFANPHRTDLCVTWVADEGSRLVA